VTKRGLISTGSDTTLTYLVAAFRRRFEQLCECNWHATVEIPRSTRFTLLLLLHNCLLCATSSWLRALGMWRRHTHNDFLLYFYHHHSFPRERLMTWKEVWIFVKSVLSCLLQGLKRTIFYDRVLSYHLLRETSC